MIRPATPEDVPQILDIYRYYVLHSEATFDLTPPGPEAFAFRERARQYPWLVWEEAGQILGYTHGGPLFPKDAYAWCAETTIYLAPQARGQGGGLRLYRCLEAVLGAQGYQKLYALITATNRPSLAFHRRLGYRFLAEFPRCGYKFGRWLGVVWLEKPLVLVENPSEPPVPWEIFVRNNELFLGNLDKITLS